MGVMLENSTQRAVILARTIPPLEVPAQAYLEL